MSTAARIFVIAVLVLFVAGIATMFDTVPTLYLLASHSSRAARSAIADACAATLEEAVLHAPQTVDAKIVMLETRYQLRSLRFDSILLPYNGPPAPREVRVAAGRTLELRFADDRLVGHRRTMRLAAIAAGTVFVTGLVLLGMALSALLRPARGDGAARARGPSPADESLLNTFGASIRTLKGRESELLLLHERERERADELATVTATLVRSMSSGFMALDARGLIVDLNQEARQLLGATATQPLAGIPIGDLAPRAGNLAALSGDLGAAIDAGTEFVRTLQEASDRRVALQRHEVGGRTPQERIIGLTTVPLLDESAHYSGMLALFTDLTPMRRLESQLREMQSLADLGEMSAGIAHEFRNSLSTIVGYLKLARRGPLPPETDERLRGAEQESQQLAAAVESLLVFARPMQLQKYPVSLRELAAATVERLQPLAGDIAFELAAIDGGSGDRQGNEAWIQADGVLLGRAVENLIRNAIDAIHEKGGGKRGAGGTIRIESGAAPHPTLVIRDNGIGLEAAEVNRLFLPFQSTKPQGFGVGLALVRKIVVLHGGTISLSGEPGVGATATIVFAGEAPPVRPRQQG